MYFIAQIYNSHKVSSNILSETEQSANGNIRTKNLHLCGPKLNH